jgi:hypothetical protein
MRSPFLTDFGGNVNKKCVNCQDFFEIFFAISVPISFIIDLWEKCIRNIEKSGKKSLLPTNEGDKFLYKFPRP